MKSPDNCVIRIGAWSANPALDEISKDGQTVKLEPKMMRMLVCLAEHPGEVVSVEQLLDEVWKDVVVTPDSVYHAVAVLRRVLGDDTKEPAYIANVLRRGYRLVAPVVRCIDAPAVRASNPPAAPEPATPAPTSAVTARSRSRLLRMVPVALVAALLLALFVAGTSWLPQRIAVEHPPATATITGGDKTIAVLPFVDLSEQKNQQYFADGTAEEVLDLLAVVPGVRVMGRTSSFQFKGERPDLPTVGSTLGAAYVVEGSIRKSGEQLRVAAQLIDARDGSLLWSQTYDEAVGDVLKIQGQIAAGIVRALQVTIGADHLRPRPILRTTEAYDAYLRGRYAYDRRDQGGFETAAGYFRQALELDPSSIRAAEWLAMSQLGLSEMGFVPPREGFEKARASAELALKLDPQSGMMHALMGSIHVKYDWDWVAAADEGKRALALEPRNPLVLLGPAQMYACLGRWDEAVRLYNAALALDPLFAGTHLMLGHVRDRTGRFAEAEVEYRKALGISPTFVYGHFYLGRVLLYEGRLEAALAEMQRETTDGGRDEGLAIVYYAMGRKAESDAALARYTKDYADNQAVAIAEVHAYRAEADQAFAWLDRAYDQKDIGLYEIKVSPLLEHLEPDPRYKAFLRKMNLPE
jgi:TolB-like protein/DNA-binding winged helix-turn-helix (wHTH) protein/Flp pilus assembly protein TadD